MEGQLFTWETLRDIAGATLLTFFIVQYTKKLVDKILPSWPTDLYAVIVAFFALVVPAMATGADPLDWRVYALSFANSFLVAAGAGQMQRKSIDPPKLKDGGN